MSITKVDRTPQEGATRKIQMTVKIVMRGYGKLEHFLRSKNKSQVVA